MVTPIPRVAILAGSWQGVGAMTTWMRRLGYELSLDSDEHGWRASFLNRNHIFYPWVGQVLRWWPTPWRAVQEAVWTALIPRRRRITRSARRRLRKVRARWWSGAAGSVGGAQQPGPCSGAINVSLTPP